MPFDEHTTSPESPHARRAAELELELELLRGRGGRARATLGAAMQKVQALHLLLVTLGMLLGGVVGFVAWFKELTTRADVEKLRAELAARIAIVAAESEKGAESSRVRLDELVPRVVRAESDLAWLKSRDMTKGRR